MKELTAGEYTSARAQKHSAALDLEGMGRLESVLTFRQISLLIITGKQ